MNGFGGSTVLVALTSDRSVTWRRLMIAVLLFVPALAFADLDVRVLVDRGGSTASVIVVRPPLQDVLDTLGEGMISTVRFRLRVGHDQSTFLSLFRSPLDASYEVVREIRYDPFSDTYVVRENGRDTPAEATNDLDSAFFALLDFPIETGDFLRCKVELDVIKLIPPMNLLAILMPDNHRESGWTEVRLDGGKP